MKKITYVDEEGNKGECSLADMVDANMQDGKPNIDPSEMKELKAIKVGQTVRLNGFMGMFTDVTRIS